MGVVKKTSLVVVVVMDEQIVWRSGCNWDWIIIKATRALDLINWETRDDRMPLTVSTENSSLTAT